MRCGSGSDFPSTGGRPNKEPRLDWFTELWWKVFRWPESEREAARRDVNAQERERKARGG